MNGKDKGDRKIFKVLMMCKIIFLTCVLVIQ